MAVDLGGSLTWSEVAGVAPGADWSRLIGQDKAPDSGNGVDFASRWEEQLSELSESGAHEICLTAEWSVLEPKPGRHNKAEVEQLRLVLSTARQLGMDTWLCLVDGTLPGWFSYDEGGFAYPPNIGNVWAAHVERTAENFGDLVEGWIPVREPALAALRGYRYAVAPPEVASVDKSARAIAGFIDAENMAHEVLRGSAPIASWQTGRLVSAEPDNVKAKPIARWLDDTLWGSWQRSLVRSEAEWDRLILMLRPSVVLDGEGAWSPAPAERQSNDYAEVAFRAAETVEDHELILAADLGPLSEPSGLSDELVSIAEEAGAVGLWSTRPLGGWNWEQAPYQYSS